MPKQHTWKAGYEGSAYNNHTGHCAYVSESINVKMKTLDMRNNITRTVYYNRVDKTFYEYTLETWCASGT